MIGLTQHTSYTCLRCDAFQLDVPWTLVDAGVVVLSVPASEVVAAMREHRDECPGWTR